MAWIPVVQEWQERYLDVNGLFATNILWEILYSRFWWKDNGRVNTIPPEAHDILHSLVGAGSLPGRIQIKGTISTQGNGHKAALLQKVSLCPKDHN